MSLIYFDIPYDDLVDQFVNSDSIFDHISLSDEDIKEMISLDLRRRSSDNDFIPSPTDEINVSYLL